MIRVTDALEACAYNGGEMRRHRCWTARSIGIVLLFLLLTAGTLLAQSGSGTFSDPLRRPALDAAYWVVGRINAQGSVIPTERGVQLSLTVRNTAPFFALNLWLNCRIEGDFDAQVSYRLETWPPANGIRLGLGVHPNPLPLGSTTLHGLTGKARGLRTVISERISLARGEETLYPSGGEFYTSEINGRQARYIPTAHREGKLRVRREASHFMTAYWDPIGRLWVPTGQWSSNPQVEDAVWVTIQLWGRERSPAITVYFQDFSVEAQRLGCPAG